jgi:predicted esterase
MCFAHNRLQESYFLTLEELKFVLSSMKRSLVILGVLISVASASSAQLVAKSLTASNGEFVGFYEYKPTDYNTGTRYPVIIFLHGIGERGNGTTDLPAVLGNGTPYNIKNGHPMRFYWNGKWETFLVLIPQLNSKYGWWPTFYAEEMINYANRNLSIDPNRIFLAGLSLGGGGTWAYPGASLENAKKLAGIAVACGTCQNQDWGNIARANLPVWGFHAADDGTVPAGCTDGAITAIQAASPAVKPYKSIYPSGQHWIWGRVFSTEYDSQHPNIYEWFLGQDKSKPVNVRPVANAGADAIAVTTTGSVTLNAGGSTDQDGRIVRYVWTKISGPNYGTITTPVSENGVTTVTGLAIAGTYVFEVRAIDDRADWTTDQVTITAVSSPVTLPPANVLPVARAGSDVTISESTGNATLDGSASNDPDGYLTAHKWVKTSGPASYTITKDDVSKTTVSGLTAGTYTFRLTVTDNNNATAYDDINIVVTSTSGGGGANPDNGGSTGGGTGGTGGTVTKVANAGADISITLPTNSTTLNGSGSTDPGGAIKAWQWTRISGPSSFTIGNTSVATTSLTNLVQGTYAFRLQVWDHNWVPTSDTVLVTVNGSGGTTSPGTGKIANAGADIIISLPTNSTTLNGSASVDPGGAIKAYEWSSISGPSGSAIASVNAVTTGLSNLVQGTYAFKLRVWDHNWVPTADTVLVTVNGSGGTTTPTDPNKIANAGADVMLALPTNSTTLNGSASADPGGAIKAYEWARISGPSQYTLANARSATTTVSNLAQGLYAFRLTVWDHNWVPKSDTMNILVSASASLPDPSNIANAGADLYITLPVNSTTLNGAASADPGGTIKAYEWSKIGGPSSYTITDSRSATTGVSNLAQGIYSFRLVVWDRNWVPKSDTVNVIVSGGAIAVAMDASKSIMTTSKTNVTVAAESQATTEEKLTVYPNPARGMINVQTISAETGASTISIYDVSGRMIQKITFEKSQSLQQRSVNITQLAPGVYHLEVMIGGKKKMITKFIKQ